MVRILKAASVLAVLIAAPAGSEAPRTQKFVMAMSMYDAGTLVSKPNLLVLAGEQSRIVVEPGDGSSYTATISVNPMQDGRLQMSGDFSVVSRSAGAVSATPTLVLEPGKMGTVEFGYNGGGLKPFRTEFIITPATD